MKIFVMFAKIVPKVVMNLSIFKIGGWNRVQTSNQKMLEELVDENGFWLLIGIPRRDPSLVTQYLERHSASSDQNMKKLMPIREGLHVMMQCHMRRTSRRTCVVERGCTMRKFTKESTTYFVKGFVCRWNFQKMRSESSEYVRKTTGFFSSPK